jgi:hypothetical protein
MLTALADDDPVEEQNDDVAPIEIPGATTRELINPLGFGPASEIVISDPSDWLAQRERAGTAEGREAAREASEQRKAERLAARQATAKPLTLSTYAGHARPLTLRAAALALAEHGGSLELKSGELVLNVPAHSRRGYIGQSLRECLDVLVGGKDVILAAMKKRSGTIEPSTLPDAEISPWGSLLS